MTDKELFPSFDPTVNDKRESTTFYTDFKIAEKFGLASIKETFNRAFKSWKDNCKYLVELCVVTNHLGWEWNDKDNEICKFYTDCFLQCRDYAFADDAPFTKEERSFFYNVID